MAKYEDLRGDESSLPVVSGTAWTFGDRVTALEMLAAEHLGKSPAAAKHALLAALDPRFPAACAPGDFIVAGLDFGSDATDHAIPAAMRALGVGAVIARSFGEAFAHNAVNVGLPALVVEETAAIKTGDRLRVDVEAHVVANLSSGDRYVIRNINDEELALLRARAARLRLDP